MPFDLSWYIPLRVIDVRFYGKVTALEMSALADGYVQVLSEGEEKAPGRMLYLLFDTSEAEHMPPMYQMLAQGLPVLRFKNRGPVFHITRNKPIRTMIEVTAHVSGFQVYAFASRAEASQSLEAVLTRDTLNS